MIATALIVGATLLVGITLAIRFWNSIITYLKDAIIKVSEAIHNTVLGVKVFLRKTSDGVMQITKNYSQNAETKKWKETIVKRALSEKEIPKEKRERFTMDAEFDISVEFEAVLTNA